MKLTEKQSQGFLFAFSVVAFICFMDKIKSYHFDAFTPSKGIQIVIFEIIAHVVYVLLSYWFTKKVFFKD